MDQTNRQIYSKLYETYPLSPGEANWVRRTIDDIASEFTKQKAVFLREDAKYFILINFTEMIVKPLRERVERDRLMHDLSHDTKLLLETAALNSRNREEISGHDIVNALSKNWGELEVMKLDLWG